VKVQFIESVGRRKKQVSHIEVKEAELEEILRRGDKAGMAQFSLFCLSANARIVSGRFVNGRIVLVHAPLGYRSEKHIRSS
jgi:hypothetical protein